jgi:hypothetical protein
MLALTNTRLILVCVLIALFAEANMASGAPASAVKTETLSSPAQALQAYQAGAMRQLTTLAGSTDDTSVEAELERTSQRPGLC